MAILCNLYEKAPYHQTKFSYLKDDKITFNFLLHFK